MPKLMLSCLKYVEFRNNRLKASIKMEVFLFNKILKRLNYFFHKSKHENDKAVFKKKFATQLLTIIII